MNSIKSTAGPASRGLRRRVWLLVLPAVVLLALALAFRTRGKSGSAVIIERMRAAGYPTTPVELDRWYAAVPDAENAALVIVAAAGELSSRANSPAPVVGSGKIPPRGQAWDPVAVREGREYLEANREAMARLMSAAALPRSRYPVTLTNGFGSMLTHLSPLKGAAQTLTLKSAVEAEAGQAEAAARSLGAVYAMGRSLEAEPVLISHLVRIAIDSIGLSATERIVNRVDLPDASLAELQVSVLHAATNRGLERALVGESCMGLGFFRLPAGQFTQLSSAMGGPAKPPSSWATTAQQGAGMLYSLSGLQAEDERFDICT